MIKRLLAVFKESSHTFEGQEGGEDVILLLRRHHFIAFMPISFSALLALIPIFVFLIFYSSIVGSKFYTLFLLIACLFYMLLWLIAFYHLMMYTLNIVIVTNKRIIDRDQHGFFDRKVSELHVYRIQDVTVSIKGILPTILKYGDVAVQTAAVDKEFIFHEMPNPDFVKSEIMKVVSMTNAGVKPATEGVNNS